MESIAISYDQITHQEEIKTYIRQADAALKAIGYTEHSFAHVTYVAARAGEILQTLGYDARTVELARIAGYMHDIGNIVNRADHAQSGAVMAFRILDKLGMEAGEVAQIISAIGNHDESTGAPVNAVAAAIILADKTDVRRSRVREPITRSFDMHDRVNYAVTGTQLRLEMEKGEIVLELTIDTQESTVMDYFEIFLSRMLMCKKAAQFLKLSFRLKINGVSM
jgi:metal-dependent HD superfamily phosphatase/phosphodiesterase